MKRIFIVLSLSLLFINCNTETREYSGQTVELNYLEADEFTDEDWIEVDGLRFDHERNEKHIMEKTFVLPTSRIVRDSLMSENVEASYNRVTIGITLGRYLNEINRNSKYQTSHQAKYVLTDKPLMMTKGIIKFHREDSSEIKIKTSREYPALISTNNFE